MPSAYPRSQAFRSFPHKHLGRGGERLGTKQCGEDAQQTIFSGYVTSGVWVAYRFPADSSSIKASSDSVALKWPRPTHSAVTHSDIIAVKDLDSLVTKIQENGHYPDPPFSNLNRRVRPLLLACWTWAGPTGGRKLGACLKSWDTYEPDIFDVQASRSNISSN